MKKFALPAALVIGLLLGGCEGTATETGDPPAGGSNESMPDELKLESIPPVHADVDAAPQSGELPGPALQPLVDKAVADLSTRLGIDASKIEILGAEFVTWRDSALGCPEPGNEYMQVLTKGSRIRLQANGQVFQYHGGGNREPFLCRKPAEYGPLPPGSVDT